MAKPIIIAKVNMQALPLRHQGMISETETLLAIERLFLDRTNNDFYVVALPSTEIRDMIDVEVFNVNDMEQSALDELMDEISRVKLEFITQNKH